MNTEIIKKYQQKIRDTSSMDEKQYIASELHSYIEGLPTNEQEEFKVNVLKSMF